MDLGTTKGSSALCISLSFGVKILRFLPHDQYSRLLLRSRTAMQGLRKSTSYDDSPPRNLGQTSSQGVPRHLSYHVTILISPVPTQHTAQSHDDQMHEEH